MIFVGVIVVCVLAAPDVSVEQPDGGGTSETRRPLRADSAAEAVPAPMSAGEPSAPSAADPAASPAQPVEAMELAPGPSRYVQGLNGFAELDNVLGLGTLVLPELYALAFGALRLRPGFGFAPGGVKLAATADWAVAVSYTLRDSETARRISMTDLGLQLSAPELFRESHTHLTFSPGVGGTVPVSGSELLTVLTAGARLEWAYRGVEVGYRVEVGRPFYSYRGPSCTARECPIVVFTGWHSQLTLSNALQVEAHVTERLSLGCRLSIDTQWRVVPPSSGTGSVGPPSASPRRDSFGWQLFASFSATRYFGATLNVSRQAFSLQTAVRVLDVENQTLVALSLWARSNPALSKVWLLW